MYGVTNYQDMVSYLTVTLEEEQYYCKALSDEIIKINVSTFDSYRPLFKQFQADNVVHHTYQTTRKASLQGGPTPSPSFHPTGCIKSELESMGHIARNVFNIRHSLTKAPLPLYFVDLEPCDNNKKRFYLHFLCNMKITVEAPRKKNSIVQ